MNDIVFINPPAHIPRPYIPIGIGYLNQILKNSNIRTKIIDFQNDIIANKIAFPKDFFKQAHEIISKTESKIFAYTIMNTSYPWAVELIKMTKRLHPLCFIIVGGPESTYLKDKLLINVKEIDVSCVYEGELVICDLVNSILREEKDNLNSIDNIYYRKNSDTVEFTQLRPLIENLDSLPIIEYNSDDYPNLSSINMDVGRGCPYPCYYCSTSYLWQKKPRFKSGKRIVEESLYYYDKMSDKNTNFVMYDHDNFLTKKNVLKDFFEAKEESRARFKYGCSGRLDNVDEETISLLEKTSCCYLFVGIESGSPRIQKVCRKNLNLDVLLPKINTFIKKGITVEANFIVGFPEETLEEFMMTVSFMSEVRWAGAIVNVSVMSPEPCTKVAENTKKEDYILRKNTPYYRELVEAEIVPEELDPLFVNHLYTIRNKNYDIQKAASFFEFYREVISFFPISVYILKNIFNHKAINFYEQFTSDIAEIANIQTQSIVDYLKAIDLTPWSDDKSIYYDILNYETMRSRKLLQETIDEKYFLFNYDIQSLYANFKKRPEALSDQLSSLELSPRKIKV